MAFQPVTLAALVIIFTTTAGFALAQVPGPPAAHPASAAADLTKMSLEQLMELPVLTVVTASKREQKTTEAPAQATVVTADDIRAYGYRTLADVLRSVPGFYTTYDRSYSYVGVRGFGRPGDYGGRTLLLLDGHRMNDPLYDTAAIGTEFILDVDLIERVEVIRGPGSALYGNNAFFAVVNVITKRAARLENVEISAEAGTYDTYKGRLTYGARTSQGTEVVASASGFRSQGNPSLYYADYDSPETANGVVRDGDGERIRERLRQPAPGGLTFEAAYVARDKDNPAPQYGTVFGMPVHTFDERGVLEGRYERALRDNLQAIARIYYDWYEYRGDYAYDVAGAGDPAGDRDQPGRELPRVGRRRSAAQLAGVGAPQRDVRRGVSLRLPRGAAQLRRLPPDRLPAHRSREPHLRRLPPGRVPPPGQPGHHRRRSVRQLRRLRGHREPSPGCRLQPRRRDRAEVPLRHGVPRAQRERIRL